MPDLDQIKQGEQVARDRSGRFAKGRSGNPAGRPRGCRDHVNRAAGRQDSPTGPGRTARADRALPVPPVLSGRDQASPTPSMTISHPLAGVDAQESTMPIWQLRDRLFTLTVGSPFRKGIAGHTYLAMSDDATAPLCLANSAVAALIPQ